MKRFLPQVIRTAAMHSARVWSLGIETWVGDIEAQFHWGSSTLGQERFIVVHLGKVDLLWNWKLS